MARPAISHLLQVEGLFGAGERFRTVDLVLGKHTLYQLSYTRSRSKDLLSSSALLLSTRLPIWSPDRGVLGNQPAGFTFAGFGPYWARRCIVARGNLIYIAARLIGSGRPGVVSS